jgi:hypothetical protein
LAMLAGKKRQREEVFVGVVGGGFNVYDVR